VFAAVSIREAVAVQSLHLRSPEGPTHVAPKSPGGPSALKILCPETKKTGTKLPGASWFDAAGTVPSPEELVASCQGLLSPAALFLWTVRSLKWRSDLRRKRQRLLGLVGIRATSQAAPHLENQHFGNMEREGRSIEMTD
jgi:hypothetical protein